MNILNNFKAITTFVFDMDGVLTDGTLLIIKGDEWIRKMHIKDGYALQLAAKKNYNVVVLSKSSSQPVKERLAVLGIKDVYMKIANKREKLKEYMQERSLTPAQILYMGDDVPDYQCMKMVGIPACPADAVSDIKSISKYISPIKGGEGCVRDVIEKVLKLHGKWELE